MKDPQVVDPRTVSAFSVYRGLVQNLTSYQDTSEGSASSRRKKARLRNKKQRKSIDQKDEKADIDKEPANSANIGSSEPSKTKKGQRPQKSTNENGLNGVGKIPITSPSPHPSTEQTEGKKKRKKKKKSKTVGTNGELQSSAFHNDSVDVSDDDEGESTPPKKSKPSKLNCFVVPNPLANTIRKGSTPTRKSQGSDSGKAQTPKPVTPAASSNGNVSNRLITHSESSAKKKKGKNLNQEAIMAFAAIKSKEVKGVKKDVSGNGFDKQKQKNHAVIVTDATYKVESKAPPPDIKQVFDGKSRVEDSVEHGKSVLDWMIHPVTSDEFSKKYWEKKPLLIKRLNEESKDFYQSILTTQKLDEILRKNVLKYGVNLDITNYSDGKRETLSENMQGRVRPAVVWDYYNNGCSLRMLNPQTYIQKLWRINSALQEYFGSFVGANMYLTPHDSQGFAPHYDDIEAFILQIEGKKQWRVYAPRNEREKLPRFSSGNFSEENDDIGEPIMDVVLEEGDLLYFPRGYIHQAKTVDGEHSLHITISCHQLNSYGDLLKHHVNHALDKLLANDVEFRQGLPSDYLSYMGIAHENSKDKSIVKKREAFSKKISSLVTKIARESADYAADAMGKKFIWDSLPPFLGPKERETSVLEDGEFIMQGKVFNRVEFGPEVKVKLARKHCVRLVVEEGHLKLYYSSENSLVYHEEEAQFLELAVEHAPIINHLVCQYPEYTKIEDLPMSTDDIGEKIQVISDFWERGLILTKKPLEACDLDEDFELDGSTDNDDDSEDLTQDSPNSSNAASDSDEDVESINLSDLPEDRDDLSDEFYDTSMITSDGDDSSDLNDADSDDFSYNQDENEELGFELGEEEEQSDDNDDEEDVNDDSSEEEEEDGEDGFDIDEEEFDVMDGMEESEDDN